MIHGGHTLRKRIEWRIVICYFALILIGLVNIYSSSTGDAVSLAAAGWSWNSKYGMQLIWLGIVLALDILLLFAVPSRFYNVFVWWIYFVTLALLAATIFVGTTVNGSKSWLVLGPLRLQPAEFAKIAVALAVATTMEKFTFSFENRRDVVRLALLLLAPMALILLEKETGLALVFLGFLLVFYREGMNRWVLPFGVLAIALAILSLVLSPFAAMLILAGILLVWFTVDRRDLKILLIGGGAIVVLAFLPRLCRMEALAPVLRRLAPEYWLLLLSAPVALFYIFRTLFRKREALLRQALIVYLAGAALILSANTVVYKVLQDHQRLRIESLLGIRDDPMGAGYNVHQSMIAIGSGGFSGKGFLAGTQTRFDFVPEQSTDFIFCTVGEEWGFVGACGVILCYILLILFLISSAERQNNRFARVYGWCVASCILMHVMINIGMTIGLMPVIGIPLPLVSYGGSSLMAFSILIFIYLRMCYEQRGR